MKKKLLSISLAVIVAVMAISGASLAWLQDTTDTVTNTFTEGRVAIDLYEHEYDLATNKLTETVTRTGVNNYKLVPGDILPKDPTVVVKANSEACYLFVKIEKSANVDTFLTYAIANGWTKLEGVEGIVYYREVAASTNDQPFAVLDGNKVTVKNTITMKDMEDNTSNPTFAFTAYAIQKANTGDAAAAWALIAK